MQAITITGLSIQFDRLTEKELKHEAMDAVCAINAAIQGLNSNPQIIGCLDIDGSQVTVELDQDEEGEEECLVCPYCSSTKVELLDGGQGECYDCGQIFDPPPPKAVELPVANDRHLMAHALSICRHCGEPIRRRLPEGNWVHDDVDEDPDILDYGWVSCNGGDNAAEPKENID